MLFDLIILYHHLINVHNHHHRLAKVVLCSILSVIPPTWHLTGNWFQSPKSINHHQSLKQPGFSPHNQAVQPLHEQRHCFPPHTPCQFFIRINLGMDWIVSIYICGDENLAIYLLVKRVLILVIQASAVSASLHQDHSHLGATSDYDVVSDHIDKLSRDVIKIWCCVLSIPWEVCDWSVLAGYK